MILVNGKTYRYKKQIRNYSYLTDIYEDDGIFMGISPESNYYVFAKNLHGEFLITYILLNDIIGLSDNQVNLDNTDIFDILVLYVFQNPNYKEPPSYNFNPPYTHISMEKITQFYQKQLHTFPQTTYLETNNATKTNTSFDNLGSENRQPYEYCDMV